MTKVMGQKEELEYFTYQPHFFQIGCQLKHEMINPFLGNHHLQRWYMVTTDKVEKPKGAPAPVKRYGLTIAVTRY